MDEDKTKPLDDSNMEDVKPNSGDSESRGENKTDSEMMTESSLSSDVSLEPDKIKTTLDHKDVLINTEEDTSAGSGVQSMVTDSSEKSGVSKDEVSDSKVQDGAECEMQTSEEQTNEINMSEQTTSSSNTSTSLNGEHSAKTQSEHSPVQRSQEVAGQPTGSIENHAKAMDKNQMDNHDAASTAVPVSQGAGTRTDGDPAKVTAGQAQTDMDYRHASSSETSDSSSSSDESSSDNESEPEQNDTEKQEAQQETTIKVVPLTKGELLVQDLPPLEELTIHVDDSVEMQEVGQISSIVGTLVVIQAIRGLPALNDDSVLFLDGRRVLGQIFEVFGPVPAPLYAIRFNSEDVIKERDLKPGMPVFFAPEEKWLTNYVFVEQLRRLRGSDASWEHNNEPPDKFLDFSDDEQERRAKAKSRSKDTQEEEANAENPGKKKKQRKPRQQREAQNDPQRNQGEHNNKGDKRPPWHRGHQNPFSQVPPGPHPGNHRPPWRGGPPGRGSSPGGRGVRSGPPMGRGFRGPRPPQFGEAPGYPWNPQESGGNMNNPFSQNGPFQQQPLNPNWHGFPNQPGGFQGPPPGAPPGARMGFPPRPGSFGTNYPAGPPGGPPAHFSGPGSFGANQNGGPPGGPPGSFGGANTNGMPPGGPSHGNPFGRPPRPGEGVGPLSNNQQNGGSQGWQIMDTRLMHS